MTVGTSVARVYTQVALQKIRDLGAAPQSRNTSLSSWCFPHSLLRLSQFRRPFDASTLRLSVYRRHPAMHLLVIPAPPPPPPPPPLTSSPSSSSPHARILVRSPTFSAPLIFFAVIAPLLFLLLIVISIITSSYLSSSLSSPLLHIIPRPPLNDIFAHPSSAEALCFKSARPRRRAWSYPTNDRRRTSPGRSKTQSGSARSGPGVTFSRRPTCRLSSPSDCQRS